MTKRLTGRRTGREAGGGRRAGEADLRKSRRKSSGKRATISARRRPAGPSPRRAPALMREFARRLREEVDDSR